MATLSEARRAEIRERLTYDTKFWAGGVVNGRPPGPDDWQGAAKILNKQRKLVPLIAHPWQVEFDDALEKQRAEGKPMRAIILKARKLGFSTWVAAKFLQRLTMIQNQHAIIVAQDSRTAGIIFEIAKTIHAHLPSAQDLGLGINIRPNLIGQSNSPNQMRYVRFGEGTNRQRGEGLFGSSLLEIDTAQSPEAGRGLTPSMLHLSEVARWPERATAGPGSKLVGILNAVPNEAETIVVMESTANGLNHYYRRWISAKEGAKDIDTGENYVPIFVPWWRDPDCAERFATGEDRERFIDGIGDTKRYGETAEDEPMLQELYGCSPEQLLWRRMMIRTASDNSVDLFKQENPSSDEEAFLNSGRPYFSKIHVAKAIRQAEQVPAPVLGTLTGAEFVTKRTRSGTIDIPTRALWVPAEQAPKDSKLLEVWEHPVTEESQELLPVEERRPKGAYVIGVDVAEGEADTFSGDTDFHAIQVFDWRSGLQVAQYESRIDRHLLGLWVVLIARYYNDAFLAIEVNSVGAALIDPVGKDYRYPHLYRRKKQGVLHERARELIGWKTDPQTKPLLEDAMADALGSDTISGLRSARAARQLQTYVQDERGRRGAMPGEHDDLLMAAMIAHRVMVEHSPPRDRSDRRVSRHTPRDEVTGY